VELSLDGDIVRGKNFTWNLAVNASRNKNKLVKLNDDFLDDTKGVITPPNTGSVLRVGDPLGLIYGYVADGIFQNQEEINKLNATAPGGVYQASGTAPGDIRFRDITGPDGVPDGKVTTLDQTVIGNAQPELSGGFTNTLEYKGLSLSALFTYSVGNDLRWGTQSSTINIGTTFNGENKLATILNRWTPQNPSNQPRVVYGDPNNNARISSFYVYDASYLRLKNLHLSYTLPASLVEKTRFLKNAQVYVTGANLWTLTKYPGANPETSNLYNDDVSTGLDNSRFPISKLYSAGIRVGF
jgi:TonB-dependent starch-binding outer membrane protein SusC